MTEVTTKRGTAGVNKSVLNRSIRNTSKELRAIAG